jgi:hypothetical protein
MAHFSVTDPSAQALLLVDAGHLACNATPMIYAATRLSDPGESPRAPKGLRRSVLHLWAKPLCCVKGPKLPDIVRSSVVTASCGQLLPS